MNRVTPEKIKQIGGKKMKTYMNLMEFAACIKREIKSYLPKEYEDSTVTLSEVVKNNDTTLIGLAILKPDQNLTPSIYLDDFYKKYLSGASMESIFEDIVTIRVEADIPERFDSNLILNLENCRERIYPRLINFKLNKKMLQGKPYRMLEDLAVIYYIKIGELTDGSATVIVSTEMLKQWHIAEDRLWKIALENEQQNTYVFQSLNKLLKSFKGGMVMYNPEYDEEDEDEKLQMYVVTNKNNVLGSSVLLNKSYLKAIEDVIGRYYILPSSIHEIIVIPQYRITSTDELREMVCEVNNTTVLEDEILSYNVYQFDEEKGFKIAK